MPRLDEQLELIRQRTGSNTGKLRTDAERAAFSINARTDLAAIINQLNNVYKPLVEVLSSEDTLNALDFGLCGNVIYTHINATPASATAFYDATQGRARTIKETVDVLISEVARLETEISRGVDVDAYDDTALTALVNKNDLNLTQLKLDTVGDVYTLDGDGLADRTYSLSQAIDAIGAFFTGFPGTGNTYTPTYPALALEVLLSDVVVDTTLPQSAITNLSSDLGYIRAFIGMASPGPELPIYSAHGSIATVSDGQTLEEAIQALDAGIAGGANAFTTTANVTSNSPNGTLGTDDFVFGSDSLDDDTDATHDARFLFDKSKAAFRAGLVESTEWDDANRGSYSAAFGRNTTAAADYSSVLGGWLNNIASGAINSFIGSGGSIDGVTGANVISVSTLSFIGAGAGNQINPAGAASNSNAIVAGASNTINDTGAVTSRECFIGAGGSNTITNGNASGIVSGDTNTIQNTSINAFIGAGLSNGINGANYSSVVGGQGNNVNTATHSFIGGGNINTIGNTSPYSVIVGGDNSTIGSLGNAQKGFIGGGQFHLIDNGSDYGVIVGGDGHGIGASAPADAAFIGGGSSNSINGSDYGVVVGGQNNLLTTSARSVICGGGGASTFGNEITNSAESFIGGGTNNVINLLAGAGVGNAILSGENNDIGDGTAVLNFNLIAGGIDNTVTGSECYAFGRENVVAGTANAVLSGGAAGQGNNIDAASSFSVILGGGVNDINKALAGIVGGLGNTLGDGTNLETGSAILSGGFNLIDGGSTRSVIAGGGESGNGNQIRNGADYCFIGAGNNNIIGSTGASDSAVIGGGVDNQVDGANAGGGGILSGVGNRVTENSAQAAGRYALSEHHGGYAHSCGRFSTTGDAQYMRVLLRKQTTDATANVELFLDGTADRLVLANDSTYAFIARMVARRTDVNGESAHYTFEGTVHRDATAATTVVDQVIKTVVHEDTAAWDAQCTADATNGALKFDVTGEALKTINWVVTVELVKVTG